MKNKILYVISNKDGFFETGPLIGHLLSIYYNGKDYQLINESFKGKEILLNLKDKPIIIKLEPNVKSK